MVLNTEFAIPFEEMSPPELNKYLQKFNLSARKRDGSFNNKTSFTAIEAALDCHLRSPPFSKPFSIINDTITSVSNFSENRQQEQPNSPSNTQATSDTKSRSQTLQKR